MARNPLHDNIGDSAMDVEKFKASLTDDAPPTAISNALQALWYDRKGQWPIAHVRTGFERFTFSANGRSSPKLNCQVGKT